MSSSKFTKLKAVYFLLGFFQLFGILALISLTLFSMFAAESFTWIYITLLGFTFGCSISVNVGINKISSPHDKIQFTPFSNFLSISNLVLIMLLILLNLFAILHNANAIDQFFGIDKPTFQTEEFTGHLILEIIYFLWLMELLTEGDVISFIQKQLR